MNKKAFTLIEMLVVVLIVGLLTSIATGVYNNYLESSKHKAFGIAEESFVNAVKEAYLDCSSNHPNNNFCLNHKELSLGESSKITLKELVDDNYIDSIKNPYDTDKFCDLNYSYVIAKNSSDASLINVDISYTVCLICNNHRSETCQ